MGVNSPDRFSLRKGYLARTPAANFTLANLMRVQLFAALATLKTGLDILFRAEDVQADEIFGHGGLFKTPLVGQKLLAAATGVPVAVMETAGEGGAWGIALLAAYMHEKTPGQSLEAFLAIRSLPGKGVSASRQMPQTLRALTPSSRATQKLLP